LKPEGPKIKAKDQEQEWGSWKSEPPTKQRVKGLRELPSLSSTAEAWLQTRFWL